MSGYKFKDRSLDTDSRVRELLKELTAEEKTGLLCGWQRAVPRLGLKELHIGAEVARGLVCRGQFGEEPTTVFPEPFGLAATFDKELMREIGDVTGIETRIYYEKGKTSLFVWGPTVDAERDPRWGRTEEGYGEDPFLIGEMSAAYTLGMAKETDGLLRVIPTLKHFCANNNEEDRGRDNASVPLGLKYDYYYKAFERAFKKGAAKSVMTSYNKINGVEALCNPELTAILKNKWGMLFSVTDGGDFAQNVQYHKSDADHTETAARVYKAHGADIMTDDPELVTTAVKNALEKGLLSESDLDAALFGVLKARFLLGEIDGKSPFDNYPEKLVCCDEHYRVTERAAEESVILLKNSKNILPFDDKEKTAVIGIHAKMCFRDWYTGMSDRSGTVIDAIKDRIGAENTVYDSGNDIVALRGADGGYYLSVDEDGTVKADADAIDESCLLEMYEWGDGAVSFKARENGKFFTDSGVIKSSADEPYGWFVHEEFRLERHGGGYLLKNWQGRYLYISEDGSIRVTPAVRPDSRCFFNIEMFSSGVERAREVMSSARQVVVFGGNNPLIGARECFDRKDLELPERLELLLSEALRVNENAVLFLVSGYPYTLRDERLSAVLHCSHSGPALGTAAARVLFGDISPAGRCPMTWYSSEKELCDIKDYNIIRTACTYLYYEGEPLFGFGHGLSYTTFSYGALAVNKRTFSAGDTARITLEIENTGLYSSDEVVQLYIAPPKIARKLPRAMLKGFERVYVPHGEKRSVTLRLDIDDLAFRDVNTGEPEVYGGTYEIRVGASSADIRRTCEIYVDAPEYKGVDVTKQVPAALSWNYLGVSFEADKRAGEYALINDWQSFLIYEGCDMRGYDRAEIIVSNPGAAARLTISDAQTEETIAELEVPITGSFGDFVTVAAKAAPISGIRSLKITVSGMLSLKSFRFFREKEHNI